MKFHLRSLALPFFASSLTYAAPPALVSLAAATPNLPGAQLSGALYLSDESYGQLTLEEGLSRLHGRWASLSQASAGFGREIEFSSHLFFRATGSYGLGFLADPGDTGNVHSDWMHSLRFAPQVVWYPNGRFWGSSLGFTGGVQIGYRASLTSRALPGALRGANAQIFAGLVL